jgi:hypothetical protein
VQPWAHWGATPTSSGHVTAGRPSNSTERWGLAPTGATGQSAIKSSSTYLANSSDFGSHPHVGSTDSTAGLRRLLVMRLHGLARLTWPLAIRWLHDAAIEDSLDHAERAFATTIHKSARWSGVVRLLRAVSLNADRKSQK